MKRRRLCLLVAIVFSFTIASACTMRQSTKNLNDREMEIAAKIAEAKRMGAKDCSPRELARTLVGLDRVRHEMMEPHYPPGWLHAGLDLVEKDADALLEKRRLATMVGARFRCVGDGG